MKGREINEKRKRRLYNELGMQLCNKTPMWRVAVKLRVDRVEPSHTNQVWAIAARQAMQGIAEMGRDGDFYTTSSPLGASYAS